MGTLVDTKRHNENGENPSPDEKKKERTIEHNNQV